MKNELVSIIIPVYNAEKTISRCLNSIQKQSYNNIEIILVNDGSEDNSLSICQDFMMKDNRIKVLDMCNSGVSVARNQGILASKGEYCCFVDSDDWIEENHVQNLIRAIVKDNADCVIQGYTKDTKGNTMICRMEEKSYLLKALKEQSIISVFSNGYIHPCWNKLFKLDVIREHNIQFEQNLHISEDSLFCIEYFLHCQFIKTIESVSYHYCDENNNVGLSKKVYENIFEVYAKVYNCLDNMLESFKCNSELKKQILIKTIYPQYYVSVLKILRDKDKTYFEKRRILDNMLDCLNGKSILESGGKESDVMAEKIISAMIIAKQYKLVGGLLKWIDRRK